MGMKASGIDFENELEASPKSKVNCSAMWAVRRSNFLEFKHRDYRGIFELYHPEFRQSIAMIRHPIPIQLDIS